MSFPSQNEGYYRYPSLAGGQLVFLCEDDVWSAALESKEDSSPIIARRLTSNLGSVYSACIDPTGQYIAFVGLDEGSFDVYLMPAEGGEATRLSFWGGYSAVVGWHQGKIVVASNANVMARERRLYLLSPEGYQYEPLEVGEAGQIAFAADGRKLIARNSSDMAHWKRYRGGRTGTLWIHDAQGTWQPLVRGDGQGLLPIRGNVASPLWLDERVYFISDHEGTGNLYSCTPQGQALLRHTHHQDFYVRHASSDGHSIVYCAGADVYRWQAASGSQKIALQVRSPRVGLKRKFVDAGDYLESYSLHPEGEKVLLVSRGKLFSLKPDEGAVMRHQQPEPSAQATPQEKVQHPEEGVRYRHPLWLYEGSSFVVVTDRSGEDRFERHTLATAAAPAEVTRLETIDVGRIRGRLVASPVANRVAFANHRNELNVVDCDAGSLQVLDRSDYGGILGIAFSPDGRWLAYGKPISHTTSVIMLCELASGKCQPITREAGSDMMPSFDPAGRYLYFISYRVFNPVWDSLQFELSFPRGSRPYLLTLQKDTPSPFLHYQAVKDKRKADNTDKRAKQQHSDDASEASKQAAVKPLSIDLEGIGERVLAFPVKESRYLTIVGLEDKVLYSHAPMRGASSPSHSSVPKARNRLESYDFTSQEEETLLNAVSAFAVSLPRKHLIYRQGRRLRVVPAGEKPKTDDKRRKNGWIDWQRVTLSVHPKAEWQQMLAEAWRLQRDLFWSEDMSGIDWQAVYKRYAPLLARVSSRSEFSDLLWEMQGELGTSHAYVMGGDYLPEPSYPLGLLAAQLRYDATRNAYQITHIVRGDPWNPRESSPLARAGVPVAEGDYIVAVNGQPVSRDVPVEALLVNEAGNEVALTMSPQDGGDAFEVTIQPLYQAARAHYRQWVNDNRRQVHQASQGRIGYLHIPDMGEYGFAEFHRGWLLEADKQGLVVDVRFNGGGNVSALLLEKLARRPLAHIAHRYQQASTYPYHSYAGPMVAITNEHAGSDGDIFSHAWKMMGLGPLVGKRTWGGVIGINVYDRLLDDGITTQPIASFHFHDVGYTVENYGTDPTIEVEMRPDDYQEGRDPQLERAIHEAMQALSTEPPYQPDLAARPNLQAPSLPELPKDDATG